MPRGISNRTIPLLLTPSDVKFLKRSTVTERVLKSIDLLAQRIERCQEVKARLSPKELPEGFDQYHSRCIRQLKKMRHIYFKEVLRLFSVLSTSERSEIFGIVCSYGGSALSCRSKNERTYFKEVVRSFATLSTSE
ncbi:MAG: hypothetical protein SNF33_03100 [Candidatus Algichlamydia australiensis]|nr:hypothetical protein [Chlamydiales bacterium]